MTRVNLVKPKKLYDQHILSEYREIPMVIGSLARSLAAVGYNPNDLRIPKVFTLNKGHVSFFYDKGEWLHDRYNLCVAELRARGFQLNPNARIVGWELFRRMGLWTNSWQPTKADIRISKDRIAWKVAQKPDWYRKTKA